MNETEGEDEQEKGSRDGWLKSGLGMGVGVVEVGVTSTAYKILQLIIKIKQLLIRVERRPDSVLPGCV